VKRPILHTACGVTDQPCDLGSIRPRDTILLCDSSICENGHDLAFCFWADELSIVACSVVLYLVTAHRCFAASDPLLFFPASDHRAEFQSI
jgi:hypothetical protein